MLESFAERLFKANIDEMSSLFVQFLLKSPKESTRLEVEKLVIKILGRSTSIKGKEAYTKLCG